MSWKPLITTHHLFAGAREARGLVVVFDVFRACSTIAAMLDAGAERIYAVTNLADGLAIKGIDANALLFAETDGIKLPEADYDNSPSSAAGLDLHGRSVILKTSSGTPGLYYAYEGSDSVIAGSLVAADAIIEHIIKKQPEHISLVAMGWCGERPAREDEIAAEYFLARLRGEAFDVKTATRDLMEHETSGVHRLLNIGFDDDVAYCTQWSVSSAVPAAEMANGTLVLANHAKI